MRVFWVTGTLDGLSEENRKQVIVETDVMFAAGIPLSQAITEDISFVELPCGAEINFEHAGNAAYIRAVEFSSKRATPGSAP